MALTPCRECGRAVSTAAPSCPGCGIPAPAASRPPAGSPVLRGLFGGAPAPSRAPVSTGIDWPRHGARGVAFMVATALGAIAFAVYALGRLLDDQWPPLVGFAAFGVSSLALGAIPHVKRFRPRGLRSARVILGLAGAASVLLPLAGILGVFPAMLLLAAVLFFADYFHTRRADFAEDRIALSAGGGILPVPPRRGARWRQRVPRKKKERPRAVRPEAETPEETPGDPKRGAVLPPRAFVAGAYLAGDAARMLGDGTARANARIAMNNVLAAAGRVSTVERAALERAVAPYGLRWADLRDERRSLYAVYLEHFAARELPWLAPESEAELFHLERLLEVGRDERAEVWREVGERTYRRRLETILADGRIGIAERDSLDEVSAFFDLTQREAGVLRARAFAERGASDPVDEAPLGGEERAVLQELAARAGITLPPDGWTRPLLDRVRWLDRALHDRPVLEVAPEAAGTLGFAAGEMAYAVRHVDAYLLPGDPPAAPWAGRPALSRQAFVDGAFETGYPLPSPPPAPRTGALVLTSARLLLWDADAHRSLPLAEVERLAPYRDGVEVRVGGETWFLAFRDQVEELTVFLDRALRERGLRRPFRLGAERP